MPDLVHYQSRGDVVVLTVDNPPVNALSPGVPEAIGAAITRANADTRIAAIVIAGAGRTFMAGADIRQFEHGRIELDKDNQEYLVSLHHCARIIEDSAKPVVMAIHGTAFGAGLEIAMAGHYRVIAHTAVVGQPEVKLGLIPGAGGTQRLPRLVGIAKAVEMCAFGEPISAQDAFTFGLIDKIIDGDLVTEACYFARQAAGLPLLRTRERADKLLNTPPSVFAEVRQKARQLFPHQTAPLLAIDAVKVALELHFHEAMHYEGQLFLECLKSSQSHALIYLFFAERTASKVPDIPPETKPLANLEAAQVRLQSDANGVVKDDDVVCIEHANSRLIEIVRGPQSSAERVRTAMEWVRKRAKVGVVVKDFVVARIMRRNAQEVEALMKDGLTLDEIQRALLDFGITAEDFCAKRENRRQIGVPPFSAKNAGHAEKSSARAHEITHRITMAMADESAAILKEGLALRESDIDLICTLACGFPTWRGGPIFYAKASNPK